MTPNFKTKPKLVWKIDGENINVFKTALSSIDWGQVFDLMCNVDVAVTVFQDKFIAAAKSAFQLKSVGAKRLHRPSLSERAIDSLRRCGSAFKKWRRTRDQADYSSWKELEVSKRRIIQSDKHRRLYGIAKASRRNPRAVWKHVKKNTSAASIPPIPIPGHDEKYIVDPQDKAEFISREFSKVYPACPRHCLPLHFTTSVILKQIQRLDSAKAAGSFLIANQLLKIAGTSVVYPLSRLFDLIVSKREFPTAWRQAEVVPIPKKGSSSFRPISLLPPLSKLFEKIVASHLSNYLDKNNLLSDTQYGFRKQRSTEMQLLHMAHQYSQALLQRAEEDVVLLDCSKAFDKLPHSSIVTSLSSHGVNGEMKGLLSDYLKGRSQRVVVEGHFSSEQSVPSGVPQGSILGPLLFTIAVNSLAKSISSTVMQYADDIVLSRTIKKHEDCVLLQQDLQRLVAWCKEVGLEINPEKSQHLRISNKRDKSVKVPGEYYVISGKKIPLVNEAVCLGVTFSSKLEWTAQVDKVSAKCRQRLYAVNAFFPQRYGAEKQLLYKSLVRAVHDYASSCWFPTTKSLQRQLESIQKKFLQNIRLSRADKDRHDPDFKRYHQHLQEVAWKPLWHRRCENLLVNVFRIRTGNFASGNRLLKSQEPSRNLKTRSQAKILMMLPVSTAPLSCKLLESTSGSFAYITEALLKDSLFCPSALHVNSLLSFKNYLSGLNFSNFMWCKSNVDVLLLV
ncbi:hypothetical protein RvY_00046 [Ramazzottius varieornatus]|uniref:Reverse transcriptase domain-containing protein n=1 Tax=Ramazzottius varieornatus TaxID=947166 RepID=A0A1D1ULC4_RAMVA|nr:hypothetical protein RvY_00046 [Ramazzottius varieornatus]